MTEINIEIDGVYCPACDSLHPVLMWHERYDEYATREIRLAEWQKGRKEHPSLFRDAAFVDSIEHLGVAERDDSAPCAACGTATRFADAASGERVCSAACRATVVHSRISSGFA